MSKKTKKTTGSGQGGRQREMVSRRQVVVLTSLLGALVLTSVLLLVMAPAPLTPDAAWSLVAPESSYTLDQIFETRVPIQAGRWSHIYIHHSKSREGNAVSLGEQTRGMGDHFLIGNGRGCADGEIQIGQRWDEQRSSMPMGAKVPEDWISICLVGDFDQAPPTSTQIRQLERLVQTLQSRYRISGQRVVTDDRSGPVGVGRHFPKNSFFSKYVLP